MNKKQTAGFILVILILGTFFRLWRLEQLPAGFYSDEALYAYEAFSLLRTGRDQFGHSWPLTIAGFGDYRPALYIYATIPFIAIFGLTEFATRLPTAIFSIFSLITLFFLVKEFTSNNRIALLSSIIFAISPWSIFFSRMAHETSLMTWLILLGILMLFKYSKTSIGLLVAAMPFSLAMYTYHTARIFVPLFVIIFLFTNKKHLKKANIALFLIGLFLFSMPLMQEMSKPEIWSRVNKVSLWNDFGVIQRINKFRGSLQSQGLSLPVSRLISNKATMYSFEFIKNFASHFSYHFLLASGDPNGIYNTPNMGILLWAEPVLVSLAGLYWWKNNRDVFFLIGGIIFLSLIPDSLTQVAPSSARIHLALPFVCMLSGTGLWFLSKKTKMGFVVVSLLIAFNCFWFWKNYIYEVPMVHARSWQIGTKQMVKMAQAMSPDYDQIWISRSGWGWLHVLFHTKYNPAKFQQEAKASDRNEVGFWWVYDVGKYHLDWFPDVFDSEINTLYIGNPQEFPQNIMPLYTVKATDGEDIFWFVSSDQLIL